MKKPKLPKKKRMKAIADMLWALAVKEDRGWKCACCGHGGLMDSHHLLPRQHTATRYSLQNGMCLCKRCHQFCPDRSPHQNCLGFSIWLQKHYPKLNNWLIHNIECGNHKTFSCRTNDAYYCNVILGLKQFVDDDKYLAIVGQKFAAILDDIALDSEAEKG